MSNESGVPPTVELSEKPAAAAVDDVTCEVDLAAEPAKADVEEESAERDSEPPKEEKSWLEKKNDQFEAWMNEDWDHVPLYWEPEYEGPPPEQLGLKGRSWHRFRHVVNKTLSGVEFVGEVTVNILGLNESKYQWVIDALEDEKRQKAQKELEESQRRMLRAQERERKAAQQAQELEEAS